MGSLFFLFNETFFFPEIILQVDVLRATALPLLKQFGIDGESFELKVRMYELLNVYICVKHFLTTLLEELYDVCACACACSKSPFMRWHTGLIN